MLRVCDLAIEMLDRYSTPEMREIWSQAARWRYILSVELAYLEALEEDGIAPPGSAEKVRSIVQINPAQIEKLEAALRHDLIAFLAHVEEQTQEASRFLHYGLTSSDALDTAFALQLQDAWRLIRKAVVGLEAALWALAEEHKATKMVGRTHGMHAEVTTFGLIVSGWREEVVRSLERCEQAAKGVAVGKLSGAVGTCAFGSPSREERVLSRLGLAPEPVATQVVCRDRHAAFFSSLAILGGTLERIAVNIRHLQRSEVGEVEEPFSKGQRGSSAMPHKKNPIDSENVCGLARLLRTYCMAAMENMALWHERDISHSSVERVIGPDATSLAEFATLRLEKVIRGLRVKTERMAENLSKSRGLLGSEAVMLALVAKGMRRQEAYALVQAAALKAMACGTDFGEALASDAEIAGRLSTEEIKRCLADSEHLIHLDALYSRRSPRPKA